MIGASTGDGLCADDEVRGAAFAVASVLEERRVLNSGPGEIHFAVVMDWRREACELLESDPELYQTTRRAIESECFSLESVAESNSAKRIEAVKGIVEKRSPDLVALGWLEVGEGKRTGVIVSDRAFAAEFLLSYNAGNWVIDSCTVNASPWR